MKRINKLTYWNMEETFLVEYVDKTQFEFRHGAAQGQFGKLPVWSFFEKAMKADGDWVDVGDEANCVPEIVALKLLTIYCDESTSLVSLTHRVQLADFDGDNPQTGIPHLRLGADLEEKMAKEYFGEQYQPGQGFPSWPAVYQYLEKHPVAIDGEKYKCPECGRSVSEENWVGYYGHCRMCCEDPDVVVEGVTDPRDVPGEWIVQDWAGNRMFPDKTFATFEDGWEYVRGVCPEADWEDISVVQATK